MKRIVVIGANGQLGSSLMEEFINHSDKYELIGLNSKDIDIRNEDSIKMNFQKYEPEIVINTAAYTDVNKAEEEPMLAYEMNACAVLRLAKQCVSNSTILVNIGSDYVFGSRQLKVLTESNEDYNPLNSYGVSKLSGELMLKNTMDGNTPWYIIRTSNLYGKNPNKEKGTFLLNCLQKIKNNETIYLNNINMMSPTAVENVSQYIFTVLDKDYGLYHSANVGVTCPYEFIQTAVNIINENNLSKDYNINNIVLKNEINASVNRPRFSYFGTDKKIGYIMPTWTDALKKFLVENRGML